MPNEAFDMGEQKPVGVKRSTANDALAVGGLLGLINNPEFAADGVAHGTFRPPPGPPAQSKKPKPHIVKQIVTPAPSPQPRPLTVKTLPDRIFLTGRLRRGKDHILNKLGFKIHGFADPLYMLQKYCFGTDDKTLPGARKFLQSVGQWGRGHVDKDYPLNATRAIFTVMIHTLGEAGHFDKSLGVEWSKFGNDPDVWLNALLERARLAGDTRIGVSNVRFPNEFDGLKAKGFTHYHVMCSEATWKKRLGDIDIGSPQLVDTSEQLAIHLDADTLRYIKLRPHDTAKLNVIWNDDEVKSPSPRFYTLRELA